MSVEGLRWEIARWNAKRAPAIRLDCPAFVADCVRAHCGRDLSPIIPQICSAREAVAWMRRHSVCATLDTHCERLPWFAARPGCIALLGLERRFAMGVCLTGERAAFLAGGGGIIVLDTLNLPIWRP